MPLAPWAIQENEMHTTAGEERETIKQESQLIIVSLTWPPFEIYSAYLFYMVV
jgi:hypothetical protein